MKQIITTVFTLVTILLNAQSLQSDTTQTANDFHTLSLEELMNIPISAGTANETSIRETPGIVTLITGEDIKRSGARDLIDVLQLVPGIEFGSDIQNFVGIGMRGLSATEGKVSLFIDNHEYNELNYGTIPFGNHFALDQIDKIEVIRGPGSAIYGGTSQFGVIKITTKAGVLNGIQSSVTLGQMGEKINFRNESLLPRKNFFLQAGNNENDFKYYINTFIGGSQRSNRDYTNFYSGMPVPFQNNSHMETFSVLTSADYKRLKMSWWYDTYSNECIDYYADYYPGTDPLSYSPLKVYYNTLSGNLSYSAKLSEAFELKPQVTFKSQNTWNSFDPISQFNVDTRVQRTQFKLEGIYNQSERFNILAGTLYFIDNGKVVKGRYADLPDDGYDYFPGEKDHVNFKNLSLYSQANLNTVPVTVTAGIRYEKHSLGFDALVPRLAFTKAFEKIHLKLLASQSFRTPYVMNYSDENIKAEKATFFEFETGYKISSSLFFTLNLYDITVKDQLYYINSGAEGGYYQNSTDNNGSVGGELEFKYQRKNSSVNVNYSYYNASTKDGIALYRLSKQDFESPEPGLNSKEYYLGFAPHKVSLHFNQKINSKLSFNLNGNAFSKRYGYYRQVEDNGNTQNLIKKYDAAGVINLMISSTDFLTDGLTLTIGTFNLMNSAYGYITPYQTTHGALPSVGREYILRLSYQVKSSF